MELRHLRYFVAVAEEGSLTVAADKRLHTAQPSLSRQMRDLELELGVTLMLRRARGIELTAAGRVFLDHARRTLLQMEAAVEATRQAAAPAKASFAIGFLTGYEMDWLPAIMGLLRDQLPSSEIVIRSESSPELTAALLRGKIDIALCRPDRDASGLTFRLLRQEPLIVLMPATHRLAASDAVSPADIAGLTLIGVPMSNAASLRETTDRYGKMLGMDLTPDHEALNLSMAISLVASTGGVALLPLYARNLLPPSVVSRRLRGTPPLVDLAIGYSEANPSKLLRYLVSRIDELRALVPALEPEVDRRRDGAALSCPAIAKSTEPS